MLIVVASYKAFPYYTELTHLQWQLSGKFTTGEADVARSADCIPLASVALDDPTFGHSLCVPDSWTMERYARAHIMTIRLAVLIFDALADAAIVARTIVVKLVDDWLSGSVLGIGALHEVTTGSEVVECDMLNSGILSGVLYSEALGCPPAFSGRGGNLRYTG
ncbi:unnamed protein product [Ceratitis capitata]|uniref:(Mediterranean fruit fly) hypothetical protein n=1 Tax=Ceratitis capitata TaxID=7213 RepID=A0A811USN1_CERCA|nr:unnamed protein product [Ceratitis capitata]